MKPRSYSFETSTFADVAVMRCRDTHYHSDCAQALSSALHAARGASASASVVLDLTGVRLFTSSALRAVRAAHVAMSDAGGRIIAVGGGEMVVNVLKFAPFIVRCDTVSDALAMVSDEAASAYAHSEGA